VHTRPPYGSVFLLSGSALAYEILLMRLFSIIQWHHFAYMVIGLALLGYGISGTVVSISQKRLVKHFNGVYVSAISIFGTSAVAGFLVAQHIPFNAEEILWDPWQLIYLVVLSLLLTIPFFFAATAICLSFMQFREQVARIYAADLLGAGIGSIGIIILLFLVFPQSGLMIIGLLALIATVVAGWELGLRNTPLMGSLLALGAALLVVAGLNTELRLSPYKALSQMLLIEGTEIIEERSSPLGLISVVRSDRIPFRHAPGLSLNATDEPLPQLALFTDGNNMTVMTHQPESLNDLSYLDFMTSALPYHLGELDKVLIVGAGGGADLLQARYHNSTEINAIELNAQIADLVDQQFGDFTGSPFSQPDVRLNIAEVRDYLGSQHGQGYDLIQLSMMDAFNASSSGLYALHESYLYTVEALQLYLKYLEPGGYLGLTRWINMPPRDTLKLLTTAISAMESSGIEAPELQLALIRSWQTSTLLIKNGAFSAAELSRIREFSQQRSFDIAYLPDIGPEEVNRFNRLATPMFYQATISLLGDDHGAFIEDYKFDLRPATDNRPYFHHFFKWETFRELFQLRSQGAMPLMEWGYLILVATLLIACLLSAILILLPLWFFHGRGGTGQDGVKRLNVAYFFFAIGLAFLMIEIAMMQRFILFLHHPIYSISVSLMAFLVFAGIGSQYSTALSERLGLRRSLLLISSGIALLTIIYLIALTPLFTLLAATPTLLKVLVTIVLIAPLAFLMGMPFPLALSSLARHAEQFIPWAWGINGCASVISASLSTLLAISYGFNTVLILAAGLYLSILWAFPEPEEAIKSEA
jgi:hypothetical protein